jgi:hypothetical protein
MGGNSNPLRVSPYNPNNDPLVNPQSGGYQNGWLANDPTFPVPPPGTLFTEPIRNYGTSADFYRDSINGKVKKASSSGTYITTFTAHRSPLGLVFDRDSVLDSPFRGDAFVLSFMPGGDSTGYTPLSPWGSPCPFVDTSRELLQIKLGYSAAIDNYTMTTSQIATGFYLPVDAQLVNNVMYVIETNGDIWRLTFPLFTGVEEIEGESILKIQPNPNNGSFTIRLTKKIINGEVTIINMLGQTVYSGKFEGTNAFNINSLAKGIYNCILLSNGEKLGNCKIVVQ